MSAKAAGRAKVAAGVAVGLGALGGAGYWIITQHPHQPPAPPGYINIKHKVGSNTFGSNKYEQLRVHKSDTKPLDPAKKAGKKTTWVKTTEWRRDEPDADFYAAEEENWLVLRSMLKGDGRKEPKMPKYPVTVWVEVVDDGKGGEGAVGAGGEGEKKKKK